MAIRWQWQKLPVDENGKAYPSLDEFKIALIERIFGEGNTKELTPFDAAKIVISRTDEIQEILDITEDARPSARGVPKPRKNKTTKPDPAVKDGPANKPSKIGVIAERISS